MIATKGTVYLGYAEDLEARIERHRKGSGARLVAVFVENWIGFTIARTWPGDRKEERRINNLKNSPRLCPICRQSKKEAKLENG